MLIIDANVRTEGQLEASVQQHLVRRWVGGAADLIFPHQHLRVQRPPLTWTLLVEKQPTEMQRQKADRKKEFLQGTSDQREG